MDLSANYFALFELPTTFELDRSALDSRYRVLQAEVHPDRFAGSTDAERRRSMQWATRVNEGYRVLRRPLERARYLLELHGHDVDAERNTAMAPEFLMEQMEWREGVMEARIAGDLAALEDIHRRLKHTLAERYDELGALIDQQSAYIEAADKVRELMFLEKLLTEVDDALADLEDA
ncbi:Co-chaperone protein HscB [bioreactor metagenome]|uniref:Co-chaperone protein HscB homolog n=2 Tax=root TaxID=1 RepID=A0A5C1E7H7_9RHOO|nr:Fe-S protein assembly co-chaperone HscB [Oryzomicrobium terrae]QEL64880.1 co-chaperone [Oryzomicrobium terrae]